MKQLLKKISCNHTHFPKILGIIGHPVSHSLSPLMHNTAIAHYNLDYIYLPFEVSPKELFYAMKGIVSLGFKGINVTVPYKEDVMEYLDKISPHAKLIGAVNTILVENGKLIGYNTDGIGFTTSIKRYAGVSPYKKSVLMLGAGGAARAVAVQLALDKVRNIFIANRTKDRAEKLARHIRSNISKPLSVEVIPNNKKFIKKRIDVVDIVINATSLGMSGKNNIKAFPYECITDKHLVCDLVYNPLETYFLKESRNRGAKILNGLGMLICQGSYSFEIWTKKKLPINIIESILKRRLTD